MRLKDITTNLKTERNETKTRETKRRETKTKEAKLKRQRNNYEADLKAMKGFSRTTNPGTEEELHCHVAKQQKFSGKIV